MQIINNPSGSMKFCIPLIIKAIICFTANDYVQFWIVAKYLLPFSRFETSYGAPVGKL